jgi:enamine deaminase RidA (YjgF/YER057c/UK114 family)
MSSLERVHKVPISNHTVLNEAYDYESQCVAFSRGMRVEFGDTTLLFISGTSAVDDKGRSIHVGDVYQQTMRTFTNIKALLEAEGADWHDVVRTTCYLADMRNYRLFNDARNDFFRQEGLDPYPASTCIGALICRADLSVEIEAIAALPANRPRPEKR